MQVKILVARGKSKMKQTVLELPVIVGRSNEVDLTIPHPAVSRQHCELFEAEGRVRVRDLGSTNGTRVAGTKVPEAVLRPHDRFTIGPFTLVVDYQDVRDAATLKVEDRDRVANSGAAASGRRPPPAAVEPLPDWDDADDAGGLWDDVGLPGEADIPPQPEAKPSDTSHADAGAGPQAADSRRVKKPPQKIASATTTTTTSGPDPELGLDLDELLEGLEGLDLNDFLKGID